MSHLRVLPVAILATLVAAPPAIAAQTVNVPRRASIILRGEERGDLAGASVARAGDVNGDGRGDVIVGAPLADPLGRSNAGAAYVVFGGGKRGRLDLGNLGARGFRIAGAVPIPRTFHPGRGPLNSGAGAAVAGAGDVNGDGLNDLLVSGRFGTPFTRTAVFVVFGRRDNAPVDLAALGAGGYVVQSAESRITVLLGRPAGDMNGDGRADIALHVAVDSDEDAGAVYVVFGKADAGAVDVVEPGPWGFRVLGGRSGLALGFSAASAPAGDVNGDGLGDLLLGAPGAGRGEREFGRGSVFVLHAQRVPVDPIILRPGERFDGFEADGPRPRQGFGFAVARLGRGFIAGAPGDPFRLRGRGGAWIVRREPGRARAIRLAGPRTGGPAGVSVDSPGDVAGRGRRSDALVVTYGRRRGLAKALVFTAHGRLLVTYRGLRNEREARISAAGAGDAAGNRRNDLIFGAPGANRAYVLAGR